MEALKELEIGWRAINAQSPKATEGDAVRILSIGGDHTISAPQNPHLHHGVAKFLTRASSAHSARITQDLGQSSSAAL